MALIDKETIRAEIERQRQSIEGLFTEGDNSFYDGQDDAYNHILSFLDSLPEQPVEGLEEAAEESWAEYEYRETPQGLYSSCYKDGFIAGADWQKAKMLEKAVEGVAEELYNDGEIHCTIGVGTCFQPGQEVYVIKKDEK